MSVKQRQGGIGTLSQPFYTANVGDARPTPVSDGGTLFELDTGRLFVWLDGAWTLKVDYATSAVLDAFAELTRVNREILAEARALRMGMIAAGTCKE